MKKITYIILLFIAFNFSYGQTKIAELTFESSGGYSTSITEYNDGTRDHFLRTDGSDISGETFSNMQGSYYFAAEDIDDNNTIALPVNLVLNNINISGYSSLELRVHLAEDDDGADEDWDNLDYVHFSYDIDNTASFNNLLWIENDGSTFNSAPYIDTDYDGTGDGPEITDTFTQFTQSITGTGDLLDIEISFNLDAGDEDIAIDNIEIWGTLVPCGTAVTWDGTAWSNGTGPDITTPAILNSDYTTLGSIGSFSACSLTLNNADLFIADNTYIKVQNDITIDSGSSIDVQPYGAIVQKNDLSSVTNNGSMTVDKLTAPMNAWYEYTYWSSPVSGETVSGALTDSPSSRRFIFNGQNFLDHCAETGNNNTLICDDGFGNGVQDDVDDNGDDWQLVSGTTPMQAGVGYATTITPFAYDTALGNQFRYTFTGDFNNGIVTVPIYRNDSELLDYNWNFIGNPYPSAIDADLFLAANSNIATDIVTSKSINGAIFLWSQNTPPSNTTNGNQALNFSNDDFAIINAVGESAGGDGITPTRFIPSGQGFFVSMSNSATASFVSVDVYTTNITFSNSMRVNGTTDNSQFFKNTNTKSKSNTSGAANKLWLNLTSDNGVFNQILVGYVNGATNDDDGISYDTVKFPTKGSALYSIIEGSGKKFTIQGKAPNDLTEEEVINLGFKTSIEVATLYTLSIANIQGDFLTNNTIYLKDNLLNKLHDLSVNDYTFTSEVGEFNDRFEIVFNANSLSTNSISIEESEFSIINLDNDKVQFNTNNNLTIETISVFDLIGRQLYHLKGKSSSETYRLSNLNNSAYIAKVELSNGSVITKKAIK